MARGISLDQLDLTALDEHDRQAFEWAHAHAVDGVPYEEIGRRHSVTGREVENAVDAVGFRLKAQLPPMLPDLTADEYQALKESIREHGQQVPILTNFAGRIFDGTNRRRICDELGLAPYCVASPLPDDQLERLALVLNIARRQLTASARRGLVAVELVRDPGRSDNSIAQLLGVSHPYVGTIRRELEAAGQLETVTSRIGSDGRKRALPAARPAPSAEMAEELQQRIEQLKAKQIRMGTVKIVSDLDSTRVIVIPDDGGEPIEIPIIAGEFTVSAGRMAEATFQVLRPAAAVISGEISLESEGLYHGTRIHEAGQGVRFRRVVWRLENATSTVEIDRVA